MDSATTAHSRIGVRGDQASSYTAGGGHVMTERRKAPAPRAQAKIKQLETRLARVEADLERVRAKAARGGGLSRERLTAHREGHERARGPRAGRAQGLGEPARPPTLERALMTFSMAVS